MALSLFCEHNDYSFNITSFHMFIMNIWMKIMNFLFYCLRKIQDENVYPLVITVGPDHRSFGNSMPGGHEDSLWRGQDSHPAVSTQTTIPRSSVQPVQPGFSWGSASPVPHARFWSSKWKKSFKKKELLSASGIRKTGYRVYGWVNFMHEWSTRTAPLPIWYTDCL